MTSSRLPLSGQTVKEQLGSVFEIFTITCTVDPYILLYSVLPERRAEDVTSR